MLALVLSDERFAEFVCDIFNGHGIDVDLGGELTDVVWSLRQNSYRVIVVQQGRLGLEMTLFVARNRGDALLCTFLDKAGTPNSIADACYRSLLQAQIEKIISMHCYS